MSSRNGDKSRHGRQRRAKIARRKINQEVRERLGLVKDKPATAAKAAK